MPGGRPSDYTQELCDEICAKLAEGKSLRTVCLADEMPSTVTVFAWMRKYPEFLNQYANAKEESADALFEETLDIADDGSNDWMEQNKGDDAGYRVNGESIQRSRLRVDTRKWMMSKMKPKKYGDKLTTDHTGSIGIESYELSETERSARIAALLDGARSRRDGAVDND